MTVKEARNAVEVGARRCLLEVRLFLCRIIQSLCSSCIIIISDCVLYCASACLACVVAHIYGLSLAGGNDKSSYRISGSFLYDGSTLQYGNNNNKRYNIRWNNSNKLNSIFTLESSIAYSRQEQVVPTLVGAALTTSMPMPGLPLTARDGQPYAWGTWGSTLSSNTKSLTSVNADCPKGLAVCSRSMYPPLYFLASSA